MIYITGDTHRDFSRLFVLHPSEDDLVIMLGDVGINYYLDSKDNVLKKQLKRFFPCTFFFVRGNHEARPSNLPKYQRLHVDGLVTGDVFVESKYPKFLFADNGLYTIGEKKCFVVNGAYSVDKEYRLQKKFPWFPDEELSDEEQRRVLKQASQIQKVDYVMTHACPMRYIPEDAFIPDVDQMKVSRRTELFLNQIDDVLEYQYWLCGHYHIDRLQGRQRFFYNDIIDFENIDKLI